MSSSLKPKPCQSCGRLLLWLTRLGLRRPVEADAVPYIDGTPGVVVDVRNHQLRYSGEVHPSPKQHNPIHRCPVWRRSSREPALLDLVAGMQR